MCSKNAFESYKVSALFRSVSRNSQFLILQVPPMYSALRLGGVRLYQAAREGVEIERPARAVNVESFRVWRDPKDKQEVHFRVVCSKGTYIRSLAHDLVSQIRGV